ncbi:MAG TPA: hypothetical protein VFV07_02540, partial [Rhizomicrobium sp.]|nr:hypothetical protein [Rhizomicrobium sp.]
MAKDVSLAFPIGFGRGDAPSIALNGNGIAVGVHRVRSSLFWQAGPAVGGVWSPGKSERLGPGLSHSVAMNHHGTVVAACRISGGNAPMRYWVGTTADSIDHIAWGDMQPMGNGDKPQVALNNHGVAVEIHQTSGMGRALWYSVGIVNPRNKTIGWGNHLPARVDGLTPSIAINDSGLAVEVHLTSKVGSYTLFYRVGRINSSARTIDWGSSLEYGTGIAPSVILTEDGFVVEAHESQGPRTLWRRIGQLDGNKRIINWHGNAVQYGDGQVPRIATNGNEVMQVQTNGHEMSYAISTIQDRAQWMQANLGLLGDRVLKQLVMPASHDAGMHMVQRCTGLVGGIGANACNTRTQTLSIAEQLNAGARYFDIRPVQEGATLYTGHFSDVRGKTVGCNGPTLAAVLNDVAAFAAGHKELIILKFSHYLVCSTGRGFDDARMRALCKKVFDKLKPWLYVTTERLGTIPLSTYIGRKSV